MEETVGAGRDGLVAVNASGADDTDGRLLAFHHTRLHTAGVAAENDVGTAFHKEGVLHVSCGMVIGKVHAAVHVPVVFHFGTFCQSESQSAEDVHNLVLYDGQRMTCAQWNGVGGAGKVYGRTGCSLYGSLCLQLGNLFLGNCLQLVDAHAHFLLLLCGHVAEVVHQCGNLALFTQVFDTKCLGLFGASGLQGGNLLLQFLYLFYHID